MTNRWLLGGVILLLVPLSVRADEGDLEKVTSKEGKFTVLLPKNPETQTSNVTSAVGEIQLVIVSATLGDSWYAAAYADYPAEALKNADSAKLLDGARDGAVANVNGKLIKEDKITLGKAKHPGRELLIQAPDGKIYARMRMYLVGNRLYQVIVAGTETDVKAKTANSVFDSFALGD
jgi:hypothetical protein